MVLGSWLYSTFWHWRLSVQPDFRVAVTGSVVELDRAVTIMKKLKLQGTPYKIYKNTAFIQVSHSHSLSLSLSFLLSFCVVIAQSYSPVNVIFLFCYCGGNLDLLCNFPQHCTPSIVHPFVLHVPSIFSKLESLRNF